LIFDESKKESFSTEIKNRLLYVIANIFLTVVYKIDWWNISVYIFRHFFSDITYRNSVMSVICCAIITYILIYWKYVEAEIVIRRNVKDCIADNWFVCAEPCLISVCMSELKWIAHRFVRLTPRMYSLFIDPQSKRTTHWKVFWYNLAFGINFIHKSSTTANISNLTEIFMHNNLGFLSNKSQNKIDIAHFLWTDS